MTTQTSHQEDPFDGEVSAGERFKFGENWTRFLAAVDEKRIREAERALAKMLGGLEGRTFLDVGSGSGLSSLAAFRLGAAEVRSFDFDPASVACTRELRRRFADEPTGWKVERGSALDSAYLGSLGRFDVVYSWGVLHHTGAMWKALGAMPDLVAPGGTLFVSLYNDQGPTSKAWRLVKETFNSGAIGRAAMAGTFIPWWVGTGLIKDLVRARKPWKRYETYYETRGMSAFHDWLDWLGGLPFEVATPEAVVDFFTARGLTLRKLTTCGGSLGCNEFVFQKSR